MWTLVVSHRRAGSKKIVSPNTEEEYTISTVGSWVPTVDVPALLEQEAHVCCGPNNTLTWVRIFTRGNPTADQMKNKPERMPKLKSSFGLAAPEEYHRRRRKEIEPWQAPITQ